MIKLVFVSFGYLVAGYIIWFIISTELDTGTKWGESVTHFGGTSPQASLLALIITVSLLYGFHALRKNWKKK